MPPDREDRQDVPVAQLAGQAEALVRAARSDLRLPFSPPPPPAAGALFRIGGMRWQDSRAAVACATADLDAIAASEPRFDFTGKWKGRKSQAEAALRRELDRHGALEARLRRSPAFAATLDACCVEAGEAPRRHEERVSAARRLVRDLGGLLSQLRAFPGTTLSVDPLHCRAGGQKFVAEVNRALEDALIGGKRMAEGREEGTGPETEAAAGGGVSPDAVPAIPSAFVCGLMDEAERNSLETLDRLFLSDTILALETGCRARQEEICPCCGLPIPQARGLAALWRDCPAIDTAQFVSVRRMMSLQVLCAKCAAHLCDAGDEDMDRSERNARAQWIGRVSGRGEPGARDWLTRQRDRAAWRLSLHWAHDISILGAGPVPALRDDWIVNAECKLVRKDGEGGGTWLIGAQFRSDGRLIQPPPSADFYEDCIEKY